MVRLMRFLLLPLAGLILFSGISVAGDTLNAVRLRDEVVCGVSTGVPGFAMYDDNGEWSGLDVDICRAVAASVLGDADKASFVPLRSSEKFTALQTGEIDVLIRGTTWSFRRDTELDITFVGVNYYDGQGFMVKKGAGFEQISDLDGVSICVTEASLTLQCTKDFIAAKKLNNKLVVVGTLGQGAAAFESGRCDVITTDKSALAGLQSTMNNPDASVILPGVITKEPLGPIVRIDDREWVKIVQWTLFALINAEEFGVTSQNAAQLRRSKKPEIEWLLGTRGDLGKQMGLNHHWAFDAIRQVGNYGEIFDRNFGVNSPLKIKRGLNALWKDGGIMYAPPIR